MSFYFSLIIIVILLQASLGLITSVATSLAGHSLGKNLSQKKITKLLIHYSFGIGLMNFLIISTICLLIIRLSSHFGLFYQNNDFWLGIIFLLLIQVLLMSAILIFHTKANPWTPKIIKNFLLKRSGVTDSNVEAISLGLLTVLANIWLIIIPLIILSLVLLKGATTRGIIVTSLGVGLIPMFITFSFLFQQDINRIHHDIIKNRRVFQILSILILVILIGLIQLFISSYGKIVLR